MNDIWKLFHRFPLSNHMINTEFFLYNFSAKSVTWNPHKLMGTLLQCSTIHFKEDVSIFVSYLKEEKPT